MQSDALQERATRITAHTTPAMMLDALCRRYLLESNWDKRTSSSKDEADIQGDQPVMKIFCHAYQPG